MAPRSGDLEGRGSGVRGGGWGGTGGLAKVLPAVEAGAFAAISPFPMTWAHEHAYPPVGHPRFAELASIRDLPAWVEGLG